MAKAGAKVALLDKETFPRDKICGDAVCTPAITILEDMGVIKELVDADQAKFADNGGFVSPSGLSYIGNSQHKLGTAAAVAVKRIHLDDKVAKAATCAGAKLMEGFEVGKDVTFDKATGLWTVKSTDGKTVKGRMLVCADGSTSRLATQLGYCTAPPQGVSSRAYIEGGTHNTDFDGVCFYPKWSLPGYAAIFKHAKDELGFCYYLIPCGPNKNNGQLGSVSEKDLKRLHEEAIKNDPFISRALGPNPKCERMRAGSLRIAGQGLTTTHADHLIIVGDAAGHIDPLTGEGIHTAMMGGKCAAEALLELRENGDFSAASTKIFEAKWMALFGHDFKLSEKGAELIWKYPILLDACANEMERVGDSMMSKWAEVMTNMRPKTYFLRPDVAIPLGFALMREIWAQKVMKRPSKYEMPTSNGKAK
jgi:menaquinone-9 beta-reductase